MKTPFDLPEAYWNGLSLAAQAIYRRVRPLPRASYEVDVGLNHLETFLADQEVNMVKFGGSFDLDPDFQRGHVWTQEQRENYMQSFIRGQAPRTIMFNCPGWMRDQELGDIPRYTFQCIDGLQRLTTFRMFMRDEVVVFDGLRASDLKGSPFDPFKMRMGLKVAVFEFADRADLLRYYLDLNGGGTVHAAVELERVRALLEKAMGLDPGTLHG